MSVPIFQVDSFTAEPFAGNPAGVCLLERPAEATWMQNVAREMNLAETAFLVPENDGFALRWFTPAVEVDLCGHATLASAHILWEERVIGMRQAARFATRSGALGATRSGDWIDLDFPATPAAACDAPPGLAAALGVTPVHVGQSRFDYLVEVSNESVVRGVRPDFVALRRLGARGVMVTARGESGRFHFVSRFFAPGVGIDEDPVTGSAHCALGPYWAAKLGQNELLAYQASERGGVVRVRVAGDRVVLGGQAVTVLRGALV